MFDSLSNLGRSEPVTPIDNDKMDRNESQLKYIGSDESGELQESQRFSNMYNTQDSSDPQEQRFSSMYTQDAYYDLPRYLYF